MRTNAKVAHETVYSHRLVEDRGRIVKGPFFDLAIFRAWTTPGRAKRKFKIATPAEPLGLASSQQRQSKVEGISKDRGGSETLDLRPDFERGTDGRSRGSFSGGRGSLRSSDAIFRQADGCTFLKCRRSQMATWWTSMQS